MRDCKIERETGKAPCPREKKGCFTTLCHLVDTMASLLFHFSARRKCIPDRTFSHILLCVDVDHYNLITVCDEQSACITSVKLCPATGSSSDEQDESPPTFWCIDASPTSSRLSRSNPCEQTWYRVGVVLVLLHYYFFFFFVESQMVFEAQTLELEKQPCLLSSAIFGLLGFCKILAMCLVSGELYFAT